MILRYPGINSRSSKGMLSLLRFGRVAEHGFTYQVYLGVTAAQRARDAAASSFVGTECQNSVGGSHAKSTVADEVCSTTI